VVPSPDWSAADRVPLAMGPDVGGLLYAGLLPDVVLALLLLPQAARL